MEINFGNPGHGGLEAPPATLGGSGTRQAAHGFPCWFWEIDFLNIPVKQYIPGATVRDSPSRLIADFW